MTLARRPAKPSKSITARKTTPAAPTTPVGAPALLADVVDNRVLFVAWLDRIRNEVHWVQDQLEHDGSALRGVLSEEDRKDFVHELDNMWTMLTQVMPQEQPPEFRKKGGVS